MVIFFDGWETGQNWTGFAIITLTRVTTNPLEGSYCLKLERHTTGIGGGAYQDNIFGTPDHVSVEMGIKYVPDPGDTGNGEIYVYTKDHTKLFAVIRVGCDGKCEIQGGDGTTLLYNGLINTWYRYLLNIRWEENKFDCYLFDAEGEVLGSVFDKTSLNNPSVLVTAHLMYYLYSGAKGTIYADLVQCQETIITELRYSESITLSEKQVEPEDAGGHWIQGFWVRHVRARLDRYLADDHNIPMAVMQRIRDNLKESF